jgi:hypothetical protein
MGHFKLLLLMTGEGKGTGGSQAMYIRGQSTKNITICAKAATVVTIFGPDFRSKNGLPASIFKDKAQKTFIDRVRLPG